MVAAPKKATCALRATIILLAVLLPAAAFSADDKSTVKGQYTGPGSCSSTSCHGGVQPRTTTTVLQNEYSTWAVQDKHPKAFLALSNDVGKRMGKILNITPEKEKRCLVCHALDIDAPQKAATFDKQDGVSCENCHGASSGWLGPHTTNGWNYQKSVDLGMYDTRDLVKRSEKCLSCHLGDAERSVDHELIAAGHPDLYFEQASFEAVMPRHWKTGIDKDPWIEIRTMVTGQAVQLRENMRRISRNSGKFWPEYAELDCFACHHNLTAPKDSWRQERGYPSRRAGNPPWNPSRYAVFQIVLKEVDRASSGQLDSEVKRMMLLVSDITADKGQISRTAASTAEVADQIAKKLASAQFDQAMAQRLVRSIVADSDNISSQGERAAEQAAMAIDSLYIAGKNNGRAGNEPLVRAAINSMFQLLQNPSTYNPSAFAKQLKAVGAVMP